MSLLFIIILYFLLPEWKVMMIWVSFNHFFIPCWCLCVCTALTQLTHSIVLLHWRNTHLSHAWTWTPPCHIPSRDCLVVSESTSHAEDRGFAFRPGHTKDHHKNDTNCLQCFVMEALG